MGDFPAAHSMDTTWFAIDSDGQVAVFESGESGCVPVDAYLGEEFGDVTETLHALPSTGAIYDLAGLRASASHDHVPREYLRATTELVVFVRELAPLRELLPRLDAETLAATSGAALLVRTVDPDALGELHARHACLGCFHFGVYDERGDIAAHGLYRYEHTDNSGLAGPYARAAIPARPLRHDAVPDLGKAARYPGRFADTPQLHPAELWCCESWGPAWLASDGKTVHPFEGRESEYAELAEQFRGYDSALVFVDAGSLASKRTTRAGEPASARLVSPRKPWWKFWSSD